MGEGDLLVGPSQQKSSKTTNKRWVVAFTFAMCSAMICKGLGSAVFGPTLHYLAVNTNSTIDQLSDMLSVRAIGIGCGALAFSFVRSTAADVRPITSSSKDDMPYQNVTDFKIFALTAIALFVLGIIFFVTPFIRSLMLLIVVYIVGGFMVGYSETGLTSLCLSTWGADRSRPIIQLNHFMFSIGGFVTPLFGSNPVNWPYFIIGIYTILVATLFCVIASYKVEDKLYEHNDEQAESRPEGSVKELWMFFVSVTMFSFFSVSSYIVYKTYIYSIVVCSSLKMTASKASILNSLLWGGFGIGRGSAVIASKYLKPSTIIKADLLGTISATVVLSIWGETSEAVMWIGSFVFGLFVSSLLPSGISWSSQKTNMTGKYLFLFLLGGNIGNAITARVGGAVFQLKPFSVIYLVTALCVANTVCFSLMNLFAKNSKGA